MKKDFDEENRRIVRCSHCGGAMRDYREGITCILCGRSPEHFCDRCHYPEYGEAYRKAEERKVA